MILMVVHKYHAPFKQNTGLLGTEGIGNTTETSPLPSLLYFLIHLKGRMEKQLNIKPTFMVSLDVVTKLENNRLNGTTSSVFDIGAPAGTTSEVVASVFSVPRMCSNKEGTELAASTTRNQIYLDGLRMLLVEPWILGNQLWGISCGKSAVSCQL
jgi:hypothetical protein